MPRDFFDPTPEEQVVVLIEAATLRKAERLVESCEQCNEEGAEIPFDTILDRVTCSDPTVTDYVSKQRQGVRIAGGRFSKKRWLSRRNTLDYPGGEFGEAAEGVAVSAYQSAFRRNKCEPAHGIRQSSIHNEQGGKAAWDVRVGARSNVIKSLLLFLTSDRHDAGCVRLTPPYFLQ